MTSLGLRGRIKMTLNVWQAYEELKEALGPEASRKVAMVLVALAQEHVRSEVREVIDPLQVALRQLAEAPVRTDQQLAQLAEAQRLTEQRLNQLTEAQWRTEERLNQLAEARRRTEEALQVLSRRLDETNRQLGGLAMTVGYTLENSAYRGAAAAVGAGLRAAAAGAAGAGGMGGGREQGAVVAAGCGSVCGAAAGAAGRAAGGTVFWGVGGAHGEGARGTGLCALQGRGRVPVVRVRCLRRAGRVGSWEWQSGPWERPRKHGGPGRDLAFGPSAAAGVTRQAAPGGCVF